MRRLLSPVTRAWLFSQAETAADSLLLERQKASLTPGTIGVVIASSGDGISPGGPPETTNTRTAQSPDSLDGKAVLRSTQPLPAPKSKGVKMTPAQAARRVARMQLEDKADRKLIFVGFFGALISGATVPLCQVIGRHTHTLTPICIQ